ncbi:MAG TPA: cysteinyl-tRNA synthetase [Thermomicrobiales bacterium]|jgi:cyanophycinase-like exopeptidase
MPDAFGRLVLFGSGETSASGRKVFDRLFRQLPAPVRVAILETPAGFQPNSAAVAGRIADSLRQGLQNVAMDVAVVPARKRGTPFSPDDSGLADVVLAADCIFLGPGSPTYAVRQLRASVVWDAVRLRFAEGATLVLSSAAVLAIGAYTLPVYEIYKVGADLGWEAGLDVLGPTGHRLVFVPHWNNREGGVDLDTSRCFMGEDRFARLRALLPSTATVVGIDEHTTLIVEPAMASAQVVGQGGVTIEQAGQAVRYEHGSAFALGHLGEFDWTALAQDLPPELRDRARDLKNAPQSGTPADEPIPSDVQALVERREEARRRREWATADALRAELADRGYHLQDTPAGPLLQPAAVSGAESSH